MTMLAVVIPFVSARTTKNWRVASELLGGTLRSVLQQSAPDEIRAVVVGHEAPELPDDPRVEFIRAPFDPPHRLSEADGIRDKFKKLSVGLQRVGELGPRFVMRLDSDDRVNRDLAAFVASHQAAPGWNIRTAYNYTPGRPYIHLFTDWVEHAILNASLLHFPEPGHDPPDPHCLFSRWGHQELTAALRCKGVELDDLPFAGACYVRHADSLSGHRLANRRGRVFDMRLTVGRALRIRPFTRQLRAQYGFEA